MQKAKLPDTWWDFYKLLSEQIQMMTHQYMAKSK